MTKYDADVAELPEHECDDWGHCMHSDTAENRLLERIFADKEPIIRIDPDCPLCAKQ